MSTQPAPEAPKPPAQLLLERILAEEEKQTKHLEDVAKAARTYQTLVVLGFIFGIIYFILWAIGSSY